MSEEQKQEFIREVRRAAEKAELPESSIERLVSQMINDLHKQAVEQGNIPGSFII